MLSFLVAEPKWPMLGTEGLHEPQDVRASTSLMLGRLLVSVPPTEIFKKTT